LRQEDVLPSDDREDQQETAGDLEEDQSGEGEAEDQGKGGMYVSQPHDGNIPEEEDEKEEKDTGKD